MASEDAPLRRLEAVAHVRQGPADDDAHGVVEVAVLELVLDVERRLISIAARRRGTNRGQIGGGSCIRQGGVLIACRPRPPLNTKRLDHSSIVLKMGVSEAGKFGKNRAIFRHTNRGVTTYTKTLYGDIRMDGCGSTLLDVKPQFERFLQQCPPRPHRRRNNPSANSSNAASGRSPAPAVRRRISVANWCCSPGGSASKAASIFRAVAVIGILHDYHDTHWSTVNRMARSAAATFWKKSRR